MCYGEVGTIKGFVYKCDCKIPLIELGGNILEMPLPLTEDVKVGDIIEIKYLEKVKKIQSVLKRTKFC